LILIDVDTGWGARLSLGCEQPPIRKATIRRPTACGTKGNHAFAIYHLLGMKRVLELGKPQDNQHQDNDNEHGYDEAKNSTLGQGVDLQG
jgi:hypothetical protein